MNTITLYLDLAFCTDSSCPSRSRIDSVLFFFKADMAASCSSDIVVWSPRSLASSASRLRLSSICNKTTRHVIINYASMILVQVWVVVLSPALKWLHPALPGALAVLPFHWQVQPSASQPNIMKPKWKSVLFRNSSHSPSGEASSHSQVLPPVPQHVTMYKIENIKMMTF